MSTIIIDFDYASSENVPTVVFIYDFPSSSEPFMPKMRSALIHTRPVLHARWNPVRANKLALCCGSQGIYTWSDEWVGESGDSEEMAECIGVPTSTHILMIPITINPPFAENFEVRDIKWSPDGKGFVLMGKDVFCCAFEVEDVDTTARF